MVVSSPGMRRIAAPFTVAWVAASAACALVSPAPTIYVTVAEGLTSPSLTEAMQVAPRMFGPLQLAEACQTPRRIARLEAATRTVDLRVGERLTLSMLRVVAVSEADVVMPGVPVVIEAEERNPPVVQLRSDNPDLNAGRLFSVGSGRFRMRVRTLCTNSPADIVMTAVVAP